MGLGLGLEVGLELEAVACHGWGLLRRGCLLRLRLRGENLLEVVEPLARVAHLGVGRAG